MGVVTGGKAVDSLHKALNRPVMLPNLLWTEKWDFVAVSMLVIIRLADEIAKGMWELSFAMLSPMMTNIIVLWQVCSLAVPPQTGEEPQLTHLLLDELIVELKCDLFGELISTSKKIWIITCMITSCHGSDYNVIYFPILPKFGYLGSAFGADVWP